MTYTADDVNAEYDFRLTDQAAQRVADLVNAAVAKALEPYQWQPIETAPEDGTVIECWHYVHNCVIAVMFNDNMSIPHCWVEVSHTTAWPINAFTYWRMPLPPAPNKEAQ